MFTFWFDLEIYLTEPFAWSKPRHKYFVQFLVLYVYGSFWFGVIYIIHRQLSKNPEISVWFGRFSAHPKLYGWSCLTGKAIRREVNWNFGKVVIRSSLIAGWCFLNNLVNSLEKWGRKKNLGLCRRCRYWGWFLSIIAQCCGFYYYDLVFIEIRWSNFLLVCY